MLHIYILSIAGNLIAYKSNAMIKLYASIDYSSLF